MQIGGCTIQLKRSSPAPRLACAGSHRDNLSRVENSSVLPRTVSGRPKESMPTLAVPRPDMPGYNSHDMDDVHTPSRYCFVPFCIPGRFFCFGHYKSCMQTSCVFPFVRFFFSPPGHLTTPTTDAQESQDPPILKDPLCLWSFVPGIRPKEHRTLPLLPRNLMLPWSYPASAFLKASQHGPVHQDKGQ